MKKLFFLLFISINFLQAQQSETAFYIGHSLSDQIPDMVKSLANDHAETSFDWVYQSIPGAPLRWQWERKIAQDYYDNPPHYYGFYDENGGLPTGNFSVMVLTESVPRYGDLIEETYEYADSFYVYATQFNPDIKVYLYEDWHCILSGTPTGCDYDVDSNPWRQRLEDDLPMWESVVDHLNEKYKPANPICLIPAAQGLAQVYDSIYAGKLPGLSEIDDLFTDNIHLSDVGKYFIACVHFASIFERSPVGLTNQLQVWWGGDFEAPSAELALKFQEIAWDVATNYPLSCVNETVDTKPPVCTSEEFYLYPNPVTDIINIHSAVKNQQKFIYNIHGQLMIKSVDDQIDVTKLSPGVYYLKSGEIMKKFIKS